MRPLNILALTPPATLTTPRLRLEALGPQHFDEVWAGLFDPESNKLTGTHATFTPQTVQAHLEGMSARDDRADWAIYRLSDGLYLGEVVLNDLDAYNRAMNFRIALSQSLSEGYGSEATRAATAYGLEVVGLHRISLGVYAFNPRAIRAYQKCGFTEEGVERDALCWQGEWVDMLRMSLLESDPRPADS